MSSPVFEALFIVALILVNGMFAMAEMALVSARKLRLQQRAEEGSKGAQAALRLAEKPNQFLSTVQVGITLIGILAGAFGGATLAEHLAAWLAQWQVLAPYAGALALALVVAVITYLSLVMGELIPKRLALNNPETTALRLAELMTLLSRLANPLVRLLSASTELGLRLLGVKPSAEPPVTEDEIRSLIDQGTQVGVFQQQEQDMVESVFRFGDRRADAIMTPRTEVRWLDLDEPMEVNLQVVMQEPYDFFPAAHGNLDTAVGVIAGRDVLIATRQTQGAQTVPLSELLRIPPYVPESMPALKVLNLMKKAGVEQAFVIDEFGGFQGLVTLHDVLEALVGEIQMDGLRSEPEIIRREDGSWLFDGMLPVDELKEALELKELPEEGRVGYQTVSGLMMYLLGQIPVAGQHVEWNGYRFEVMDMDNRRVDKVLVQKAG